MVLHSTLRHIYGIICYDKVLCGIIHSFSFVLLNIRYDHVLVKGTKCAVVIPSDTIHMPIRDNPCQYGSSVISSNTKCVTMSQFHADMTVHSIK